MPVFKCNVPCDSQLFQLRGLSCRALLMMAKMPTKRVFSRAPGPSEKNIWEKHLRRSFCVHGAFEGSTLLLLFKFFLLEELKKDCESPSHWSWRRMTPWSWRCPRGKDAELMLLLVRLPPSFCQIFVLWCLQWDCCCLRGDAVLETRGYERCLTTVCWWHLKACFARGPGNL